MWHTSIGEVCKGSSAPFLGKWIVKDATEWFSHLRSVLSITFSTLSLMAGWQERHLATYLQRVASRISGNRKLRGGPANPGSPTKKAIKMEVDEMIFCLISASQILSTQSMHCIYLVFSRPPNFHCHRGGWLPPSQHRHCGVLQCCRRSFWVLFPDNCPSLPQTSNSHQNATSFDPAWTHSDSESLWGHRPPSPTCLLPHSQTTGLPGQSRQST